MAVLKIYHEQSDNVLEEYNDPASIASRLQDFGIGYERWNLPNTVVNDPLVDFAADVKRIQAQYGFQSVDVLAVDEKTPNIAELRQKFLKEHIHTEDEVRFFVVGSGLFYLHVDNYVLGVLCEASDFLQVPTDVKHWFDLGAKPLVKVIRFFTRTDGWVANYTGDNIAAHFPLFEGQSSRVVKSSL